MALLNNLRISNKSIFLLSLIRRLFCLMQFSYKSFTRAVGLLAWEISPLESRRKYRKTHRTRGPLSA